jgi:hypothetical protein
MLTYPLLSRPKSGAIRRKGFVGKEASGTTITNIFESADLLFLFNTRPLCFSNSLHRFRACRGYLIFRNILLRNEEGYYYYAYSLRVVPIRTLPLLHFVIYAPMFGFMTILTDSL